MYDETNDIIFNFCNMFSAKILENMEETQHDYIAFLKGKMLVKLIVNFKTIK
jgi:hypothetical protein